MFILFYFHQYKSILIIIYVVYFQIEGIIVLAFKVPTGKSRLNLFIYYYA